MKTAYAITGLSMALASAHAQEPVDSAVSAAYETPPVLKASDIWEDNLLSGPYHRVREDVDTSNFTNTYTVDSDFGIFIVQGDNMLFERVREIYAIAALRETKNSAAYAKAVGSSAANSIKGAGNLIKDPAGSIAGIGKGAGRFMRSLGERIKTSGEGNSSANDLKQYTEAKRQIAGEYKVDPFTMDGGAGRLLFNALGTVVIFSAVYATASRTRHLAIFAILISRLASLYRREHDPS